MLYFNKNNIIKYYENIYAMYMKRKYLKNTEGNMENLLIKFPKQMIQKMNQIVRTGRYGSRAELIREYVRRGIGEK